MKESMHIEVDEFLATKGPQIASVIIQVIICSTIESNATVETCSCS